MSQQKKITVRREVEEQQSPTHQEAQHHTVQEFATVEELLRQDARDTLVPPIIAQRLEQSLSQLPAPPRRPWWRRILGGPGS
jgi:hypothetical protein